MYERMKLDVVRLQLTQMGLDAILVTSGVNYRYLSGFTGSNGLLLIGRSGERVLFTDSRYTQMAKQQAPGFETVLAARGEELAALQNRLTKHGYRRIGFEDAAVSVRARDRWNALDAELIACSDMLRALRLIKTPGELSFMKKAAHIADLAYKQALNVLREGVSELDVRAEIDYAMLRSGAQDVSFPTIVAFGKNSALPHAVPSRRRLKRGDAVLMDFGCVLSGYCSDMTRTVFFGSPDSRLKKIYSIVLDAQTRAAEVAKPGACLRDVDAAARTAIARAGYDAAFIHGLGHGVGLEIHEPPTANARSDERLRRGMTLTLEPGIYLKGVGGVRIEDLCVITESGVERLTKAPKRLLML